MKYKALAILLIAVLGGMAIYYNYSVSTNTETGKVEVSK
jgi:hypothetical protein